MMFHIIYWISKKRQLITHKSRFFCWWPVFFSRGEISIVHRSCWQKGSSLSWDITHVVWHHFRWMPGYKKTTFRPWRSLEFEDFSHLKTGSGLFLAILCLRCLIGSARLCPSICECPIIIHEYIYIYVIKITCNFHSGTLSCHLNELYWSMSWCFQNWGWEEWWRCGGPRPIRFLCQLILCFLFCKAIMSLTWNPGRSWGSFRWFSTSCLVQHCNGPRCWPQIAHLHSK